MDNKREIAEQKLQDFERMVGQMCVTVRAYTYVHLFQVLQELFFQQSYDLVISLCNILNPENQNT